MIYIYPYGQPFICFAVHFHFVSIFIILKQSVNYFDINILILIVY